VQLKLLNSISVLFFGDIVGKVGRKAFEKGLPILKDKYNADFCLANCENATHGRGCSYDNYLDLINAGADCLTSGNHFYGVRDVFNENYDFSKLVRPFNMGPKAPLVGTRVFTVKGMTIRVTNMIGLTEMTGGLSNPFTDMDGIIANSHEDFHIVDLHAEATGEKRAFAEYLNGRVSLVVGTHTHVQTNDAQVLSKGTGFISDLGMCGLDNSCIGANIPECIQKVGFGLPFKFEYAEKGLGRMDGIHAILGPNFQVQLIEPISFKVEVN